MPNTLTTVNSIPSLPEASALFTFMPNPKPITEYWSSFFDIVLLNAGNASPTISANAKPKANATGDDTQCAIHANSPNFNPNTSSANPKSSDTPITATTAM